MVILMLNQTITQNVFGDGEVTDEKLYCSDRNCHHEISLHGHIKKCQCHHPRVGGKH